LYYYFISAADFVKSSIPATFFLIGKTPFFKIVIINESIKINDPAPGIKLPKTPEFGLEAVADKSMDKIEYTEDIAVIDIDKRQTNKACALLKFS